jgi:hypothetical protein
MGPMHKDLLTKDLLWARIGGLINYFKLCVNKSQLG